MSIALTAGFVIKDGMEKQFETVALALAADVLGKEPGVRMYQLCRSQASAQDYRLIEVYDDAAALAAHGQTEWFQAAWPKLNACLAGKPVIEKFDFVAG